MMSNQWHFVVWPEADGQVTVFFRWLAHTHAMRWRVAHWTVGYGHLDQGRFKSFPVRGDEIDGPMRQGGAPPPACEVILP
jgi:REP-associated tyrosine transposase